MKTSRRQEQSKEKPDDSGDPTPEAPANPATASSPEPETSQRQSLAALQSIRDLLDRQHRQTRQHDFSLLRLFAALLQMFALVAGLWGIVSILDDAHAPATARLTLACFLQLASISIFAIDRFR